MKSFSMIYLGINVTYNNVFAIISRLKLKKSNIPILYAPVRFKRINFYFN